jgi:hypothetical protein
MDRTAAGERVDESVKGATGAEVGAADEEEEVMAGEEERVVYVVCSKRFSPSLHRRSCCQV